LARCPSTKRWLEPTASSRRFDAGRRVRARVVDLFIAATARVHAVPLFTRNRKDFEPFANLIEIRDV
jgi:predicted nucleic acid-binding protein